MTKWTINRLCNWIGKKSVDNLSEKAFSLRTFFVISWRKKVAKAPSKQLCCAHSTHDGSCGWGIIFPFILIIKNFEFIHVKEIHKYKRSSKNYRQYSFLFICAHAFWPNMSRRGRMSSRRVHKLNNMSEWNSEMMKWKKVQLKLALFAIVTYTRPPFSTFIEKIV